MNPKENIFSQAQKYQKLILSGGTDFGLTEEQLKALNILSESTSLKKAAEALHVTPATLRLKISAIFGRFN